MRGKDRDAIVPMTVLRRLDAVLEPTKKAVLDAKVMLDKAKIVHQGRALRQAAEQYNLVMLWGSSATLTDDLVAAPEEAEA